MSLEQRTHLARKIDALYGWCSDGRRGAYKKVVKPDTAAVTKARALVAGFDEANAERRGAVDAAFNKAHNQAREALLFYPPADALAFVNNLKPLKVTP